MDSRERRGPGLRIILFIPALLLLARGMRHRREWQRSADGERRLPPRIEATLGAWHARAHAANAEGARSA